ncbi:hypothetical protein RJ640_024913 [Escallonia rubra]|uniref:F-box associated beta-propeller type 3 domain-containing protein n=1 Tax=Escallonia rubra TaxID=112253 RepID=A0AA88UJ64_9ASTE|nr:hypothetical protein RJ640_024913 [Escallonia rubra]
MANKRQNPKKKKAVDKPVPEKAMHEQQQKLVMDNPIDDHIKGEKLETSGESTDTVTTNGEEQGDKVEKKVEEKSKILVSFSNENGTKHNFGWTSLEGGEAVHLVSLPGCNKGKGNPCLCYLSESINGLVCFSNGTYVYLLNPSSGSHVTLPASAATERYLDIDTYSSFVYSSFSFGYDPVTKEYKVLHVHGTCRRAAAPLKLLEAGCEALTISESLTPQTLTWRAVSDSRVYPYVFGSEGVCVNGAMHWLDLGKQVVVAFDLEVEKFYLLPLPRNIPSISSLTQIAGRLALLSGANSAGATELWVLEDYPSSRWIKKCVAYLQNNEMGMSPVGIGTVDCGLLALTAPPNLYELKCDFVPLYQKDRTPRVFRISGLPSWVNKNGCIRFSLNNHVENSLPLLQLQTTTHNA